MRPLTAHDILWSWEVGQRQSPSERALTVLAAVCPEMNREQLADLSLGQRDRRLLQVREWLFGPELHVLTECPHCHERLEFPVRRPAFPGEDRLEPAAGELTFSEDGYELQLRLLNSRDLAAAADCSDPRQARVLLIERCLVAARHDGESVAGAELPEAMVIRLADRLAECDPESEVLFDLNCPACAHGWQAVLDIATFFWMELAAYARRLLHEVHTLARAYGWREADILNMSPWRRRCYLEMVGA